MEPNPDQTGSNHVEEPAAEKTILRAEGLMKKYGGRKVVDGVDISVGQGEIVGLLGPNGAGKTTTFYMITGMIRPNHGDIFFGKKNIRRMAMYRRARMGIGYLSQEASIFRKLTVEQNIMAVLQALPLSRHARIERLDLLMNEMSITRIARSKGYTLSGGERRRTEIARALAAQPKFLLLDEPFAGIDPIAVEDIQSIIKNLRSRNIGILITDHNVHETLAITDHAYLLFDGKVLKSGTSGYLAEDPEARKLYLGEQFQLR